MAIKVPDESIFSSLPGMIRSLAEAMYGSDPRDQQQSVIEDSLMGLAGPMNIGMKGASKLAGKAAGAADDPLKKLLQESLQNVGKPLQGESGKAINAMAHEAGGSSIENMMRGSQFFRIDKAGNVKGVLPTGGEDAVAKKGEAIIELTMSGDPVVKDGGILNAAMQKALDAIASVDAKIEEIISRNLK